MFLTMACASTVLPTSSLTIARLPMPLTKVCKYRIRAILHYKIVCFPKPSVSISIWVGCSSIIPVPIILRTISVFTIMSGIESEGGFPKFPASRPIAVRHRLILKLRLIFFGTNRFRRGITPAFRAGATAPIFV